MKKFQWFHMAQTARVEADAYTIEVDEDIPAIVHRWESFVDGQAYRDGCNELLEFIREHDYNKLLIDTKGIKAHQAEDKRWLQEEWMPREIEAGIEYSVSVPNDSVISKSEMETLVDQTADLDFTYVMAEDLDQAREWLAAQ